MQTNAKTENTDGLCFRSDDWLRTIPGGVLIREAVLDYFSLSPFYDRACINERAKIQGVDPSKLSGGFEYTLHPDSKPPHLFVIHKLQRGAPTSQGGAGQQGDNKLLGVFYVLDGTIYPGPSLHAVLQSRTLRCIYSVREAFSHLSSALQAAGKDTSDTTTSTNTIRSPTPPPSPRTLEEERLMDDVILRALEIQPQHYGSTESETIGTTIGDEEKPVLETSVSNTVKEEDLNVMGLETKKRKLNAASA